MYIHCRLWASHNRERIYIVDLWVRNEIKVAYWGEEYFRTDYNQPNEWNQ